MKNKMIPAILIGAGIGALVSLIDKSTRESVVSSGKEVGYYAKHPDEAKNKFQNTSGQPSKFEQLKDEVMFWKDTVEQIRRENPELEQSIMDAKDTFMNKREQKKLK
ncbi:hypothetical protein [Lacicoccus qingdaonensis]|uniref:Gas vesicle protein n=1 Tax=Lacicoccus qingdaonensis TaxID=576118 RepID=A0A1G9H3K0_9BACL|nr:hypothetical protein [Salinicoccus qingdaonensis]SDL07394.1 hypothetical protein SAMN05216216_12028 [Salinicoccus qingdaonensis]